MTAPLKEGNERIFKGSKRFISHTQIDRYLRCPEQYRLYYIEGLRLKVPKANLVFGSMLHESLALFFNSKADPVKHFAASWSVVKDVELAYGKRDSWQKLKDSGQALLEKFVREEAQKIQNVRAIEKRFELSISNLDLPFVGIIDLVADLDNRETVIDFKTGASEYDEHEAVFSDQLSAYKLAVPEAEQSAFCVFVKTREPKIEWYRTARTGEQLRRYLAKVGYVAREIAAGNFYQRFGPACAWCDFLPACAGDEKKVEETLVQIQR